MDEMASDSEAPEPLSLVFTLTPREDSGPRGRSEGSVCVCVCVCVCVRACVRACVRVHFYFKKPEGQSL